jgi:electron-transferring-flavoprotein dehydrogenase
MVREYGPDDWDRVFRTARKMVADESGSGLFDRRFAAGWDATKLFARYKWNKRRLRKRGYVSIPAGDYVY